MFGMEQHDLVSWTMAHPAAATALATMALVAVGLVIGLGQIGAIAYGIWKMGQGNRVRAEQHREAMDTEAKRHKEAMDSLAAERASNEQRHKEAMEKLTAERAASERRHEETMEALDERYKRATEADERRHEEAMKALDALIRNTAPGAATAG